MPQDKITISHDGLLRLPIRDLKHRVLTHYYTGLFEPDFIPPELDGLAVEFGFTEWVSLTHPVISLSWDWYSDYYQDKEIVARENSYFSNVRLIDSQGMDLPFEREQIQFDRLVRKLDWQKNIVLTHVN